MELNQNGMMQQALGGGGGGGPRAFASVSYHFVLLSSLLYF